jgi:hypothetical protein
LRGARAGDPGAPTINAKKHRQQIPWEVPELKIRVQPPSTLENIDDGPPERDGDPRVSTINVTNVDDGPPRWCRS